MLAHFFLGHCCGEKLFALWCVNAVKTGPCCRGGCDAEVDLGGAGIEDHLLDLSAGRPAHNAVIDKDHAFALNERAVDVELEAHTHISDAFRGFDKGPAHVLIADDAHRVGNAALL